MYRSEEEWRRKIEKKVQNHGETLNAPGNNLKNRKKSILSKFEFQKAVVQPTQVWLHFLPWYYYLACHPTCISAQL